MLPVEKIDNNKAENDAWYLLHVYPGFEDKVKTNIIERLEAEKLKQWVSKIVVPKSEAIDDNELELYSGWIVLKMRMNKNVWGNIRNTPGLIGFVGFGNSPTPFHNTEWKQFPFYRLSK